MMRNSRTMLDKLNESVCIMKFQLSAELVHQTWHIHGGRHEEIKKIYKGQKEKKKKKATALAYLCCKTIKPECYV